MFDGWVPAFAGTTRARAGTTEVIADDVRYRYRMP